MNSEVKMKRILFTHYGDNQIRGSERCLLDLVKHLDRKRFIAVVWCNSELLAREIEALDVTVYRAEFPILFGWLAGKYDFRGFLEVVRQGLQIVTDEAIDILHANSGAPNQWLNVIARVRKLPLVSHLHSRYPLRDRLTLGLHNTSRVVGVSQPIIDQLLDDGIDPARVQVVPNGIDTAHQDLADPLDLRQMLDLRPQDFIAMTTASLIHRKGVDLLIQAIARLRRRRELPVHLVIAGDGPERESLEELARSLDLEHCVHFLGSRDDVARLLRGGVDVFVSGAREEVFGLVLAEANLASLAVIAPEVGGIPCVIDDHVSGFLVPPESSVSISEAIACLYDHPEMKDRLGRAGRSRVLSKFNIEAYVEHFEAIYVEMLRDPGSRLGWFSNGSLRSLWRTLCKGAGVFLRNLAASLRARPSPCGRLTETGRS
jgi:glycosyltransferase involved in cell wall biosynthesis